MPTIKAKKVFKNISENLGKPIGQAMIEEGYSPSTAETPQNLTESKGWKELMAQYLPDDKLAEKHNKFLNSDREEIGIKALDMGYKLKGSYAPEKSVQVQVKTDAKDISKHLALKEKYEQEMLETIKNE